MQGNEWFCKLTKFFFVLKNVLWNLFLSRPEKYLARDLISQSEREIERDFRLEPDHIKCGLMADDGKYNVCPRTRRRDTQRNVMRHPTMLHKMTYEFKKSRCCIAQFIFCRLKDITDNNVQKIKIFLKKIYLELNYCYFLSFMKDYNM